jgi:hypothetical protein
LRPTAKQLFLEVSPLLDEPTATRALMEEEFFSSIRLSSWDGLVARTGRRGTGGEYKQRVWRILIHKEKSWLGLPVAQWY